MTQALVPLDLLPGPALVVDGAGLILSANRAAQAVLDLPRPFVPVPLAALAADAPDQVEALLRRVSRSPEPSPGALHLRLAGGRAEKFRCDGALLAPAEAPDGVRLLLQLRRDHPATDAFLLLNAKIEQLTREVSRRTEAEEQLRRLLDEKEALIREIHHRVKNNLQLITGLIQLQTRGAADDGQLAALRTAANRVAAVGLVHSRLYDRTDRMTVDAAGFVPAVAERLPRALGRPGVRVACAVDGTVLPVDTAVPAGLILNELVSNALRHAYPADRKGAVRVELGTAGDRVRLRVADDGLGWPDPPAPGGSGWKLVDLLSLQLRAAVVREPTPGGGATVALDFPRDQA